MSSKRVQNYVESAIALASAEDSLERVSQELLVFSKALEKSQDLYEALSDKTIPSEKRQQIVSDLLTRKSDPATAGFISMLISVGRIRDLPKIANELAVKVAESRQKEVAFVRTAVELDESAKRKLAQALSQTTGKDLDLKVFVDPSLVGGVVATIGDTVVDGSVKTSLQKLRESLEQ